MTTGSPQGVRRNDKRIRAGATSIDIPVLNGGVPHYYLSYERWLCHDVINYISNQ